MMCSCRVVHAWFTIYDIQNSTYLPCFESAVASAGRIKWFKTELNVVTTFILASVALNIGSKLQLINSIAQKYIFLLCVRFRVRLRGYPLSVYMASSSWCGRRIISSRERTSGTMGNCMVHVRRYVRGPRTVARRDGGAGIKQSLNSNLHEIYTRILMDSLSLPKH